ncbi:MAG TPA: hypothetical protein VLA30_11815 [Burkholderiales bacterium]|nr:hypothetical protein [Burkholderiales bacterium]
MTLSETASVANLIAAFGVIGSLLLLVIELRKSNEQGRLNNWHAAVTALREHKRRTDDPRVADVIARGRASYEDLSISEKITFGYWMEELLQGYDALLLFGNSAAVSREETYRAVVGAFRHHFEFPGCKAWWRQSGLDSRWPRHIVEAVETSMTGSADATAKPTAA